MKAVDKNTFYKSTNINQAIAVRPNFSDLADGGLDTTMKLQGGINPAYFLLSGAVADTPAYGESELIWWLFTNIYRRSYNAYYPFDAFTCTL